jgi:predicted AlkP superfamily pyrophosphatase or phosphodiesterase
MKHLFIAAAAVLVTSSVSIPAASAQSGTSQTKPDLVVLVAIDQFSSLLFDKWRGSYKSGLKRIVDESIVYSNAYQSHGVTETCAGHSTMLTGKHPGKTGIVANEWYDTKTGKVVYCVADAEYSAAHDSKARKVGPSLLLATTLGDWLKEQQPGSRVVAVSGKDRASITMAGHHADGVFWYEDNFGFTTYVAAGEDGAAKLAPLATLNARIQAEASTTPEWTYFEESCRNLEDEYQFGKVTWRSKLPPELPHEEGKPPGKVRPVHIIDPLTLEAARNLVGHYELGRRGVTDLLAVSLSATDLVGHGYGTQGPEMCDQVYRLDARLGEFLNFLDGLGSKVLVVFTGDHGGADFPERLQRQGYLFAKRIDGRALLASVNSELRQKLSLTADPLASSDLLQFYAVNNDGRQLSEPTRSQVIDAAVGILNNRSEVEEAFALKDLLDHKVTRSAASEYSSRDRYAQSVMAGRSGDIIVAYKSGMTTVRASPTQTLMGHTGPYRHDTAVPIIFWWHDGKPQTRILPIDTTAIAPTLANVVGVKAPGDLDGTCMDIGYPGAPNCKQ